MLGPRIYHIPFSSGKSYIGQTGRTFKSHLKQHISNTKSLNHPFSNTPLTLITLFSLTKQNFYPLPLINPPDSFGNPWKSRSILITSTMNIDTNLYPILETNNFPSCSLDVPLRPFSYLSLSYLLPPSQFMFLPYPNIFYLFLLIFPHIWFYYPPSNVSFPFNFFKPTTIC